MVVWGILASKSLLQGIGLSMVIFKRIVCLANSRKTGGSCVAGRERFARERPGAWVRPVSVRQGQEVSDSERRYEDGGDPQVLDIIDVPVLRAQPTDYQKENWLLDPAYYWTKVGRVTPEELAALTDPVGQLWTNGYSTYNGLNDRMPPSLARGAGSSLRLIRVGRLGISVLQPGLAFGNEQRRLQGRFRHAGVDYCLRITDPVCESQHLERPIGDYTAAGCYLTISFGEPYTPPTLQGQAEEGAQAAGFNYKFIAAVIPA